MPYTLADAGFLLRNWWALVIRGALAVVFAIITSPSAALAPYSPLNLTRPAAGCH